MNVVSGLCPISNRIVYALYQESLPVVPATIYLRHLAVNVGLKHNTLAAAAYALATFFRFLKRDGTSLDQISQATIKQYKRMYLLGHDDAGRPHIKRRTARQYLTVIKHFVWYWRGLKDNDPLFNDPVAETDGIRRRTRGRGVLAHGSWLTRVPNSLWRIRIPHEEMHSKRRYKGLSREAARAVWRVLDEARYETALQEMLYWRDRAIYSFMLMTCLRKGELVRVRWEDCDSARGFVHLRDRIEDARLGDLKTGAGEIFVADSNPLWRHFDSWLLHGRPIAEENWRARGQEDHGMLFCNRDGSPLTQLAVDHLFARVKRACGFGDDMFFHPHITRHTMASEMLNGGVPIEQVQRLLRHRSIASTEIYAQVSTEELRAAVTKFWMSYEVTL